MNSIGPETLKWLLAEHGGPLLLYARQWSPSPEDVVQEVLLKLIQQSPPPENLVGWLYRAVRNRAISASRSLFRRSRHEEAVSHRGEPWFRPTDGQRLDAAAATDALGQLPLEEREVVIARLWGGLSFREIADLTGSSATTAARRYQSGLTSLRERLGIECPTKIIKNSRPT
jgi:RNA polymerase sigma factor (sigma-70 family)